MGKHSLFQSLNYFLVAIIDTKKPLHAMKRLVYTILHLSGIFPEGIGTVSQKRMVAAASLGPSLSRLLMKKRLISN